MGRALKPPPQLGHTFCSELTQSAQNVHSKEQISASVDWGGRSAPQFSQQGRSSSMAMASESQFYRLARAAGPMIGVACLPTSCWDESVGSGDELDLRRWIGPKA